MPTRARIALYASFLLALVGVGWGLAGLPSPIMFACVGLAAIGLFVLMPVFIYRVPKPAVSMSLQLTQTGDDALGVVRGALAAIGWVETRDPALTAPLHSAGGSDSLIGAVVVAVVVVGVDAATVKARSVVAPPAPAGSEASLLCHPPKARLDDIRTIVRVSIAPDAWGSSVTLGGTSVVRDERRLRTAMTQLRDAIAQAGR